MTDASCSSGGLHNDGIFDYPTQTGGGNLEVDDTTSVTKQFYDDYFGKSSSKAGTASRRGSSFNTGTTGSPSTASSFLIGFGTFTFANRIKAKRP